jgi:hypothetical protein
MSVCARFDCGRKRKKVAVKCEVSSETLIIILLLNSWILAEVMNSGWGGAIRGQLVRRGTGNAGTQANTKKTT